GFPVYRGPATQGSSARVGPLRARPGDVRASALGTLVGIGVIDPACFGRPVEYVEPVRKPEVGDTLNWRERAPGEEARRQREQVTVLAVRGNGKIQMAPASRERRALCSQLLDVSSDVAVSCEVLGEPLQVGRLGALGDLCI